MNRDLPPAAGGPRNVTARARRGLVVLGLCSALLMSLSPGWANADELTDTRDALRKQLAQSKAQVGEFESDLEKAVVAYDASKARLADAEASLASAEAETATATQLDKQRADELAAAEAELKAAQDEVVAVKADLVEAKKQAGQAVREDLITSNPLAELSFFLEDLKSSDLGNRVEYSRIVFASRSQGIDRLTELQFKLEAAEQRASDAKAKADAARQAAAQQLETTRQAEARASGLRDEVATLVASNATIKGDYEKKLADEQARSADLVKENAAIDKKIAEEIARKKAEEEARRKAAEEAKKNNQPAPPSNNSGNYQSNSSLYWPAIGKPGSPYGMRYHPILHYWRMHEGTDIGASCNSPLYAAGNGVVSDRYWSNGYGNRLILDVGKVNGSYISVGYAHANSYIVSKGQSVTKGQIIGYVGSTGLSTECHLHLEVWQNGTKVNPMNWF